MGEVPPSSPALPLLKTILTNVTKPDEKYRRIRVDGSAGAKLKAQPETLAILAAVGFEEDGGFLVARAVDANAVAAALKALEPKEKLTLKQQARRDAEKRRTDELAAAKRQREETKKQIERDNRARKEDPNWKPKAVVKGGKDINTFRGKYGEDKGGG